MTEQTAKRVFVVLVALLLILFESFNAWYFTHAAWSAWDKLSTLEGAVMAPELAFALYLFATGRESRTTPLPLVVGCLVMVSIAGYGLSSVVSIPPANKMAFDDILGLPILAALAIFELYFIRHLRGNTGLPPGA